MAVPQVGFTVDTHSANANQKILEGFIALGDLIEPSEITEEKIEEIFNQFKCAFCAKEKVINICGNCKNVSYCNITCQKDDRPHHKNSCTSPIYYTEDKVMELLKDVFKSRELETKDFHFLFEGEKNTRVHHLIAINNPDCLTLEAYSNLTVSMKRIIATDGTFPFKFNSLLKDNLSSLGPLYLYTGQIKGIRAYDVFSNVTLKL